MAINPVMLSWLTSVRKAGAFEGLDRLIDLGPQDLSSMNAKILEAFAKDSSLGTKEVTEILEYLETCRVGDHDYRGGAREIYRLLGIASYESVDLFDERADHHLDLNDGPGDIGPFDVVTNFGTAEHIFNIGQAFRTIHEWTRVGGIALHVLPVYGNLSHCFYNINPPFYRALAAANGYRVESMYYAADMGRRQLECLQAPPDRLPLRPLFRSVDYASVDATFADAVTRQARTAGAYPVMDYMFVALRRLTDAPFQLPAQSWPGSANGRIVDSVRTKPVILFGAGNMGQKAAVLLHAFGVQPVAFMDNDPTKWDGVIAGLPVRRPRRPDVDAFIVVTSVHDEAIVTQLESLGLEALRDFCTYRDLAERMPSHFSLTDSERLRANEWNEH